MTRIATVIVAALVVWSLAAPARATEEPASPAPTATAPSATFDQTSPKALLQSLFRSQGEMDEAAIRALLHPANEVERKIVDSVVQVELARTRLQAAQREKFGKPTTRPSASGDTAGPSVTPPALDVEALTEVDSFEEKIDGDRGTVSTPKVPGVAMEFVRVDGVWKLPVSSVVGQVDPAMADTLDATTRAQIAVIDGITEEVKSGKLTSEGQVREELKKRLADRLAAAARNGAAPATTPSTAPVSPAPGT